MPLPEQKPHLESPMLAVDDENARLNCQRMGHKLAVLLESYRQGQITEEDIDKQWTQMKDIARSGRR